jgi:hypothetical protein
VPRTHAALRAGHNEVTLAVPPVYDLVVIGEQGEGLYLLPLPEALDDDQADAVGARCDVDGRVRFERVPAGRYALALASTRGSYMVVDVPAAGEVRLAPVPATAFMARVFGGASAPLVRAGLANADYIVAIDGERLATAEEGLARIAAAATDGRDVALGILRGGARMTMTVHGSDLQKAMGVELVPVHAPQ